jgi:hypothetical protein
MVIVALFLQLLYFLGGSFIVPTGGRVLLFLHGTFETTGVDPFFGGV